MPINDSERFPVETDITGAKSLIRNGLMQTDMDAQGYRILHLNTTNLVLDELHTTPPVANNWFNSYDAGTHTFGVLQPNFTNIAGNLTRVQQLAITSLGTITEGAWQGSIISGSKLATLDQIRPPLASVGLNNQKITSLADPLDVTDAVNLRTLNARLPGLQPKAAVRAATTSNITLAGLQVVDGITLVDNDRVLVKDQIGHQFEGIYNAHPGAWTLSIDSTGGTDPLNNAICFVLEGNTHQGETWLRTDIAYFPINQLGWVLYSELPTVIAGPGLDQSGTTIFGVGTPDRISIGTGIDIDENYAGQDSIGILGTIFQGTWEGDIVGSHFGGTGYNNNGNIHINGGDFEVFSPQVPVAHVYSLKFNLVSSSELTLPSLGTLATVAGEETFTNKHISADQVDSGVLLITNGGTNANNEVAARNNLLPIQDGHAGQTLHTDGTNVYWA